MYYITNQENKIIAIDYQLLEMFGIEDTEKLYTMLSLDEISFDAPAPDQLTVKTEDQEKRFDVLQKSLISVLGSLTLHVLTEEALEETDDSTTSLPLSDEEETLALLSGIESDEPVESIEPKTSTPEAEEEITVTEEEEPFSILSEPETPQRAEVDTVPIEDSKEEEISIFDDEPISILSDTETAVEETPAEAPKEEETISIFDDEPISILSDTETAAIEPKEEEAISILEDEPISLRSDTNAAVEETPAEVPKEEEMISILDDEPISILSDTEIAAIEPKEEEAISILEDEPISLRSDTDAAVEETPAEVPKEEETISILDDEPISLLDDTETTAEETPVEAPKEEAISLPNDEPVTMTAEEESTPSPLTMEEAEEISYESVDIASVSDTIGISSQDYLLFLDEFKETTFGFESALRDENSEERAEAITILTNLSTILHLKPVTAQVQLIASAEGEALQERVNKLYETLDLISGETKESEETILEVPTEEPEVISIIDEPEALSIEEEVLGEPAFEIEEPEEETPVESSSASLLEGVKPVHFDFQMEESARELGLPVELIDEFVHDFIDQAHTHTKEMLEAYEKEDLETIQKIGHLLKGASSNLRINPLADTLYEIQFCDDFSKLEGLIKNYWAHFISFETQIKMTSN